MGDTSIDYNCEHKTEYHIHIDGIRSLYLCPDCFKKTAKQILGELIDKLWR